MTGFNLDGNSWGVNNIFVDIKSSEETKLFGKL